VLAFSGSVHPRFASAHAFYLRTQSLCWPLILSKAETLKNKRNVYFENRLNVPGQDWLELQRDKSAPLSTPTVEDEVANRHDLELTPWSELGKFSTPPTARARTLFEDEETGEDDFELLSPSPSPLQDSFGSGPAVLFQDLRSRGRKKSIAKRAPTK
jgi:hypothetical protein